MEKNLTQGNLQVFRHYLSTSLNLSRGTLKIYNLEISRFLSWLDEEGLTPAEVTPQLSRLFIERLQNLGISDRSINGYVSTIRTYYKFLATQCPFIDRARRAPKKVRQTLSEEMVDRVLQSGALAAPLLLFGLFCLAGLRCDEVAHLRLEDIHGDLLNMHIFGKGRKERIVPICEQLKSLFADYISSPHFTNLDTYLFEASGRRLSSCELRIVLFNNFCDYIPKELCHPHIMRHTFATRFIRSGGDVVRLCAILGHESLETTYQYLHLV